ncbi:MAG: hypothetical protein J6T99_09235 [Oscillospiraceae bacterium]|nr:hypothetical protein [Oscillospiraceae bacterium]
MKVFQANKPEVHLFILWNNGYSYRDTLIDDLKSRFTIKAIIDFNWQKELFNCNLKRFYGQKLPKNSNKMKECGNGPFTAFIVEDPSPVYSLRVTTRGVDSVNINVFDIKERYRRTAKNNILHATNSEDETEHDVTLLLGKSFDDLDYEAVNLSTVKNDLAGSDGWKSIQELLYVLNHTCKYVVLRNFEEFPDNIQMGEHSDVDILCQDYMSTKLIINGKDSTRCPHRVQNIVKIGNSFINVDLRHLGDNYLDKKWEKDILNHRELHPKGFYAPNESDYFYSLLYHVLIQKKIISKDYIARIKKMSGSIGIAPIDLAEENMALETLTSYMKQKEYLFAEPKDYTVCYNFEKVNQKAGIYRNLLLLASKLKHSIQGK